jgi:O-antigen/teichoic acid export membrane protein
MALLVNATVSPTHPTSFGSEVPAVAARGRAERKVAHGFYTLVDQAVVSLASAVTTVMVGRACSKEELGVFSFGTSLLWRAMGISTSLVWSPYASRAPHYAPRRLARFAGSAMLHAILLALAQALALAVTLLVVSGGELVGYRSAEWLPTLLWGLIPLVFFTTLREHARRTSIADFRGGRLLALDIPLAIIQLALLGGLWYAGRLTVLSAMWCMSAASALSLIWFLYERPHLRYRWRLALLQLAANFRFGGWLLAVSVAWLGCDLALRGLLTWFHGLDAMGSFASANTIVNLMNPLILAATTYSRALAAQTLAAQGRSGLRKFTFRGSLVAFTVACVGTLALAIWGEPIVELVFGSPYASGSLVLSLALGLAFQGVAIPVEAAQMALEQGRELFLISLLRLAITTLAGVPLVWLYGAAGIGLTLAVQGMVTLAANWMFYGRSDR